MGKIAIYSLNTRMEWLKLENNSFLVVWLHNQFIYGFKIFIIDKATFKTTYSNIEKPQNGESLADMIERLLIEYNVQDYAIKVENNMDVSELNRILISKGFNKYTF